nr:hypothetical protein GCM10020063_008360 [Dactylosporangium thailandense]
MLTTAGAAVAERTLLAVSAGLGVLALSLWWPHRRRNARRAATAGTGCGCGGTGCGC